MSTHRAMARLQKAAYWRQSCCFSSLANWPETQYKQYEENWEEPVDRGKYFVKG